MMTKSIMFVALMIVLASVGQSAGDTDSSAVNVDPMCTDDHSGGLGCNFEKGICGGVVTELDLDSHWGWTNTTEGPIGTHVDARDSTVVGGHYIYLDGDKTAVKTASLDLYLSPKETSICLSLYYATTGTESLVLRVVAQYGSGNTLLEERKVNTAGQWEHLSLPLCLIGGGQRNFLAIQIEGFSANQTIALDYLEITKSLRTCYGKTFSLQCSCGQSREPEEQKSAYPPESFSSLSSSQSLGESAEKGIISKALGLSSSEEYVPTPPSSDTSGCSFKTGLCERMSLSQSHVKGSRWRFGNATHGPLGMIDSEAITGNYLYLEAGEKPVEYGPASFLLDLPKETSGAVRVRIGYTVLGEDKEDVKLSVFFKHSYRKTLLTETSGAQGRELDLDCCMDGGHLGRRQVIIEGSYGKTSPSQTVAIHSVDMGKGTASCPSDELDLPESDQSGPVNVAPASPDSGARHDVVQLKETVPPPSSPTPEAAMVGVETQVMDAVGHDKHEGISSGDISGIIAGVVSGALTILLLAIGVLVWRRKPNKARAETELSVFKHGHQAEISEVLEDGIRVSNPMYGTIKTSRKTAADTTPSPPSTPPPQTPSPPMLVLENPVYGGISKV